MYLRLAFSVAIHMNPQILLADEILAVGDQAFQERCLQKVAELGRDGLTVLFVSHDMDAIMRICNRVMWLHQGAIRRIGRSRRGRGRVSERDLESGRHRPVRARPAIEPLRGSALGAPGLVDRREGHRRRADLGGRVYQDALSD